MPSWLAPLFEVLSAVALRLLGSPRPPRAIAATAPPDPAEQVIRDDARAELAHRREADAGAVYDAAEAEARTASADSSDEKKAFKTPSPEVEKEEAPDLGAALLDAARADLGVHETAPNDSPVIHAMLAAVGVVTPAAWCAAAVTTWLRRAALATGQQAPIAGSASAKSIMAQLQTAGRWVTRTELVERVAPGWVLVWQRGAPGSWTGHVGVVEAVDGEVLTTIEGNSGAASDRVARMTRLLGDPNLLGGGWVD